MTPKPALHSLFDSYTQVRDLTIKLCEPLTSEDHVPQPIVDVSPPKWHLGHTTWFFENFILANHKSNYKHFQKELNFVFNSYYESQGPRIQRANRGNLTRPTVQEILNYRKYVDEQIIELISSGKPVSKEIEDLLEIGIHHEQQHQELLITDLKYILGTNPLFPSYLGQKTDPEGQPHVSVKQSFLEIPAGLYEIGYQGDKFSFDNEKGRHQTYLHDYRIVDRLVTNREYLEFIENGGYKEFSYWLSEGWDWVNRNNVTAPLYWFKNYDEWFAFTLHGLKPLELEAPVTHVSYYEADAYARWKNKRLPTEFEWEVACSKFRNPEFQKNANLLDVGNLNPIPRKSNNFQFIGDVWEWTCSAYLPYPFYKQAEGALGEYNGKFMVNQMVLRGGSCATPASHIRSTYRNFFHADKQWQFSGIRLAEHC